MATNKEILELALHSVRGTAPANFEHSHVEQALLDCFRELGGSINSFMKNRYDIYEIIMQVAEEVVPKKVIGDLAAFADVRVVPQGQRVRFTQKVGKQRAKKFLTQVGLAGVYETFRLDTTSYELVAHAIGGATTIDFERFLDGAESLMDLMEIITEGMVDAVFLQVQTALRSALNATGRPTVNKVSGSYDAAELEKLINVVRAYGQGVVIFAPPEFVSAMGPDAVVAPITSAAQGIYPADDINAIHETGFIRIFRGAPIVMMRQSFVDETNDKTWIDPRIAYVLPTGGEKVVKVVLEGEQQIKDWENRDWSMEIHTYRKLGVAILTHHNWGIYENTGIDQTMDSPYGI